MQSCMGKRIEIFGVERLRWLMDLVEQVYGRVRLCAFEVLCKHVRSGLEDGAILAVWDMADHFRERGNRVPA